MNYGVILKEPKFEDFVFGEASIRHSITLDVSDWRPWYSRGEAQRGANVEPMSCVTASAIKIISAHFNYLIRHGLISDANLQWLIDNGYIVQNNHLRDVTLEELKANPSDYFQDFSERFTAKSSGTTRQGNNAQAVADSIRHDGLVPQGVWDFDPISTSPDINWDWYYAEIPQEVKDLGKEFAKRFEINYEQVAIGVTWITDATTGRLNALEALKHSPLQVYVHAWARPLNGVYTRTLEQINHAVSTVQPEWFIFDSYLDFDGDWVKQLSPDFNFYSWAFTYNITEKNMDTAQFCRDNDLKYIRNQSTGAFGRIMRGELRVVVTDDRAALMLLDDAVRTKGLNISNEQWELLPKSNF